MTKDERRHWWPWPDPADTLAVLIGAGLAAFMVGTAISLVVLVVKA